MNHENKKQTSFIFLNIFAWSEIDRDIRFEFVTLNKICRF